MRKSSRALVLLALVAAVAAQTEACTSACIRHTDCSSDERCISGTCIVVTVGDGSTVDAMTATPSSTTTPTATATTTSTAPPAATGVPSSTIDAGTTLPTSADASLDQSTF
ncbi:MAG TPA: hypothetical protein VH062_04720 [Polyangiaceae bacterium]|jgi:hypothetical protein|nr:hypothetical protein [Polyangiaceae bacterium]